MHVIRMYVCICARLGVEKVHTGSGPNQLPAGNPNGKHLERQKMQDGTEMVAVMKFNQKVYQFQLLPTVAFALCTWAQWVEAFCLLFGGV